MADELQPWQRPPFPPGHEINVTHGGYTPRRFDPLAESIMSSVLEEARLPNAETSYLLGAAYRPQLWAWARTEARVQLVSEWLLENGGDLFDDVEISESGTEVVEVGRVRAAAKFLARLEATALRQRVELGLTPLSRARLGRDVAATKVDLAQMFADLAKADAAMAAAEAARQRSEKVTDPLELGAEVVAVGAAELVLDDEVEALDQGAGDGGEVVDAVGEGADGVFEFGDGGHGGTVGDEAREGDDGE